MKRTGESLWLTIDVGNSHTVAGVYGECSAETPIQPGLLPLASARFRTDRGATADELRAQIRALFGDSQGLLERVSRVLISSVVPALDGPLTAAFRGVPVTFLRTDLRRDFTLDLPFPNQLGADRLANVAGALLLGSGPFLIVDAGTATTFCAIDSRPAYIGGAIVPGLEISWKALQERAAKLFSVELVRPETSLGRDTESQIRSGVLLGYESLIEGLCDRLVADARGAAEGRFEKPRFLATGGCAQGLQLSSRFEVIPDLTLLGLLRYGQLNVA